MKLTVETLRASYLAERSLTDYFALANPPTPIGKPEHCRYCGKHWRHWNGSKLDGHARCVVGDEFKLALLDLSRATPTLTLDRMREQLDDEHRGGPVLDRRCARTEI